MKVRLSLLWGTNRFIGENSIFDADKVPIGRCSPQETDAYFPDEDKEGIYVRYVDGRLLIPNWGVYAQISRNHGEFLLSCALDDSQMLVDVDGEVKVKKLKSRISILWLQAYKSEFTYICAR